MTEDKSEVIPVQCDNEETESDSDSFYDSDEWNALKGQFYIVYGAIVVLILIGTLSAQTDLLNVDSIETALSKTAFGYAAIPLLASVIGQLGIQASFEEMSREIPPMRKGAIIGLPPAILSIAAGIKHWRKGAAILSVLILSAAALLWAYHGKNTTRTILWYLLGLVGLALVAVAVLAALY